MFRRDFVTLTLRWLGLAAIAPVVSACGGSGGGGGTGGSPGAGNCTNATVNGTVDLNHGHILEIPQADIIAGVDRTYSIQGTSAHSHDVTITAAEFQALAAKQSLTARASTTGSGHAHNVSVSCA